MEIYEAFLNPTQTYIDVACIDVVRPVHSSHVLQTHPGILICRREGHHEITLATCIYLGRLLVATHMVGR